VRCEEKIKEVEKGTKELTKRESMNEQIMNRKNDEEKNMLRKYKKEGKNPNLKKEKDVTRKRRDSKRDRKRDRRVESEREEKDCKHYRVLYKGPHLFQYYGAQLERRRA
jgi:hypothetical protein